MLIHRPHGLRALRVSATAALLALFSAACSEGGKGTSLDGAADAPAGDVPTDRAIDRPDTSAGDAPLDTNQDTNIDGSGDGGMDTGRDGGADVEVPDGAGDAAGPLREARSFTARATFTLTPSGPGVVPGRPLPTEQALVVRIDPVAKTVTLGARGVAGRAPVQSTDGVRFVSSSPSMPISLAIPSVYCGANISYATLSLDVAGDQLTGTGTGRMFIIDGDVAYSLDAAIAITGTRDVTGPTFGAALTAIDPLPDLFLPLSEPVPPGSAAGLNSIAGTETVSLVPFSPMGVDVVVGFHKTKRALNYGITYALSLSPGTDLANNAVTAATQLTTVAAPPVVAEDGFESAGDTVGGVSVIMATRLPPIAGQRSAIVWPRYGSPVGIPGVMGDHLAVRLAVAAGDTVVRLSLRPLGALQSVASTSGSALRVAVPGGAITQAVLPPNEMLKTEYTVPTGAPGAGSRVYLGDTRTIEIPLPAGVGAEVVVDLTVGPGQSCGLLPPTAGYLVDDVRVQ